MSSKASGGAEGELPPAPPPAIERNGVRIVDTFAEAFGMRGARVVITAQSPAWAKTAALSMQLFGEQLIELAMLTDLDTGPPTRPWADRSLLLRGSTSCVLTPRVFLCLTASGS